MSGLERSKGMSRRIDRRDKSFTEKRISREGSTGIRKSEPKGFKEQNRERGQPEPVRRYEASKIQEIYGCSRFCRQSRRRRRRSMLGSNAGTCFDDAHVRKRGELRNCTSQKSFQTEHRRLYFFSHTNRLPRKFHQVQLSLFLESKPTKKFFLFFKSRQPEYLMLDIYFLLPA